MSENITATQVKEMRDKTGLPLMTVKKALVEANGDQEKAIKNLREQGHMAAASKSARATSEGTIGIYLHSTKKLLATVVVECESDFVAKNEEFQEVAHKLAMHVAAINPKYVRAEDIPEDDIAKEKEVFEKQLEKEGKPKELWEKILPGKLEKFYADSCLMNQNFALDEDVKIEEMVNGLVQKFGENVRVRSFEYITV